MNSKQIFSPLIFVSVLILFSCGPGRLDPESELLRLESERAELEDLQEEYMDATVLYLENLIGLYPNNPFGADAALRLAEIYRIRAKNEYENKIDEWIDRGFTGSEPFPVYDKAKNAYLQVINKYEGIDTVSAIESYYALASILEEEGNLDSASIMYRKLVERYPGSSRVPAACFRLGLYYFNFRHEGFGKIDLAIDYFRKVLEYPNDPNYDKAIYMIGWLNRVVSPDSIPASITHFLFLLEMSEEEGKTELADEAVMYLGFDFSELPNGIVRLQRVLTELSEMPKGDEIVLKLAETFKDKVDYSKAIEAYNTYLSMYPRSPKAPFVLRDLASLYAEVGDMTLADATMDRLVENYGADWQTNLSSSGDSSQISSTDSLIREAMLYTAGIHHRKALQEGTYEEWATAAQRYANFMEQYPEDPEVYGLRFAYAEANYEMGKFLEAAKSYSMVALDETNDTLALTAAYEAVTSINQWYSQDSASSERQDSMIAAATRYMEIWDNKPGTEVSDPVNISMSIGKILYEAQRYEEAMYWYKKVVEDFPTSEASASASAMVAQTYYNLGDLSSSETWFLKAASQSSDTTLMRQAAIIAFQSASNTTETDTMKAVSFLEVHSKYSDREEGRKALFNAGVIFFNAGNETRAVQVFNSYIRNYDYLEDSLLYSAYMNVSNIAISRAERADSSGTESRSLWNEAAMALESFIAKYPASEGTREAVFWTGKAFFGAKNFADAQIAFGRIAEGTSFSEEIHYQALHRQAMSLDSLGLQSDADNVRRRVLKDYLEGGAAAGITPYEIEMDMVDVVQYDFEKVKGTQLYWPIDNSFPPYDTDMKIIADYLTRIASLKVGLSTIASLYLLGQCNEDYARAFREAEYDPAWTEEEQIYFQEQLEQQALPYEDASAQFYNAAKVTAEGNGLIDNVWYRQTLEALENLKNFRPDLFPEELYDNINEVEHENVLQDSTPQ
ncbi:tetratricopeptide repeat protein [candidate division WOR-3 bacterium]|nr:tetratricopeptide repeat protein [candidate division WOR-3 bacterium]